MKKKTLALLLALVLVFGAAVGGTIAYLTDKTASITNTFTVGNINIDLAETTTDFKMVPGCDIAKDPKVTVVANSEACWLFVRIDESTNLDDFISYTVASGWTQGDGTNIPANVWYRSVTASTTDQTFSVLTGDKVTVKNTVTKTMMDALTDNTRPTLTFTACAVQADGFSTAAAAYAQAPAAFKA